MSKIFFICKDGSTPLFKASHKGHARVVETLLNHHIKPELGLLKVTIFIKKPSLVYFEL